MSCCGHDHHHEDHAPAESMSYEDQQELNHFNEIVDSFLNYRTDSLVAVGDKKTATAVEINTLLTNAIVADRHQLFGQSASSAGDESAAPEPTADRNISKVRSTLKQFVREWSVEGKPERDATFAPIFRALGKYLPVNDVAAGSSRPFIVCPGCGLGRLPYELAKAGYDAQGNEFSYHMILGSHFILNSTDAPESFALFPYCLKYSDSVNDKSRLRSVRIPDEVPMRTEGSMSMCAGEFVETYEKQGMSFVDGVVTCFFLDTAKNPLLYIRTIAGMLKPNAVWINIGPLLYHFADQDDATSVELSWEELRECMQDFFTIEEEEYPVQSRYSGNQESLVQTVYNCVFFVAKRNNVPVEGFSNPVF